MAAGAQDARSFIERGLACYGRGDLPQALGQWREALRVDPSNDEAKKLVSFVEERMSAKTPIPPAARNGREPSPLPDLDEDALSWSSPESTSPESDAQTAARLLRAEVQAKEGHEKESREEGGERKRRPTLVSMLPELLAPSTLPEDLRRTATVMTAVSGTVHSDGIAHGSTHDVITRQVGQDRETPQSLGALNRNDTPLDLALAQARDRGKILVRQCKEALAAGKPEAAATAAEEALEEADKAPAPGIAEVIEPARSSLEKAFLAHLGRPGSVPTMAVDDATVNTSNFDHRTGFLLSCIDGTLPIETLIDISGMGRFEAVRTLSRLLRRRIIKVS